MRRLAVLIASFMFLSTEASAHPPASLWILWSKTGTPVGQDASALDTFKSRAACQSAAKTWQARYEAKNPDRPRDVYKEHLCFPVGVTPMVSIQSGGRSAPLSVDP